MDMSEVDIDRVIEREAIAARLLASANILSNEPGGKHDSAKIQRHIASFYPDTSAGKAISLVGDYK